MASFDDWLTASDPKLFAESLAAQFRLTQTELEKAQEAMQPAFALGLQRALANPAAWGDLAKTYAAMMPAGAAFGLPQAQPAEAFMQAMFGSDALTGAIARQASTFAGIAPATMQQMMPGLAMLTMETLVRSTLAGLARNQPPGLATGDYGSATAEMMRRGANAVEALTHPSDQGAARRGTSFDPWSPSAYSQTFAEAVKAGQAWMPPAPSPPRPAAAADMPKPFDPIQAFAALFDAFSKGMGAPTEAAPTPPAPAPAAATPPPPEPAGDVDAPPTETLVDDLFRSGQKFQAEYAKEMANLFERYQGTAKAG
ncbi:hypothetical protein [Aureimonas glaciei]|uniref:DUF937 domain-containing protein n=1 Tax=Aureimonas glaciei TaxID=1776957 RepID=A0A916XSX8_9HYPH|nr:hypothetical protein [Aureimonas glaciei]GGD06385.1 hypothetical protein GCM10011335_06670 [Aureimonas glaciei]